MDGVEHDAAPGEGADLIGAKNIPKSCSTPEHPLTPSPAALRSNSYFGPTAVA